MENKTTIMTAETIEAMTIEERVNALNETESKETAYKLQTAIENDLKVENQESVKATVETFAHEAARDVDNFFAAFISEPYADVRKLKQDKDSGEWAVLPGKKRISFMQVDAVYGEENKGKTIAQSKRYAGMISRFTHNLYLNTVGELSEGVEEKQKIVRVTYQGKAEAKTAEYDFSGNSIGKLAEQLDAVVKTIMPEGKAIQTVRADVRYIIKAFANAKDGKVKTINEQRVTMAIFDALRVRKGGKAYEVESTAKCHKTKKSDRTEKQEEVMSRVPSRPEAETCNNLKPETAEQKNA